MSDVDISRIGRIISKDSDNVLFRDYIYRGGFVYATNGKTCIKARAKYSKDKEIVSKDSTQFVYAVSMYEKNKERDVVDLNTLSILLRFSDVYEKHTGHKINYIKINNILFGIQSTKEYVYQADMLDMLYAGTTYSQKARALISKTNDATIVCAECRPKDPDYSYIDYNGFELKFADVSLSELVSSVNKQIKKLKEAKKKTPQTEQKLHELETDAQRISDYIDLL